MSPTAPDPTAPDWVDTPLGKMISTLYWSRVNRGIQQPEVAEALGIHASGLSRRERGLAKLTAEELIRWADHLGFEIVLREKVVAPPMPKPRLPPSVPLSLFDEG